MTIMPYYDPTYNFKEVFDTSKGNGHVDWQKYHQHQGKNIKEYLERFKENKRREEGWYDG